jgi:hypothetical protein
MDGTDHTDRTIMVGKLHTMDSSIHHDIAKLEKSMLKGSRSTTSPSFIFLKENIFYSFTEYTAVDQTSLLFFATPPLPSQALLRVTKEKSKISVQVILFLIRRVDS